MSNKEINVFNSNVIKFQRKTMHPEAFLRFVLEHFLTINYNFHVRKLFRSDTHGYELLDLLKIIKRMSLL